MAIHLVLEDETRMCSIMRDIYCEVANRMHCSKYNVDRNIRTLIFRAWKVNKELLIKMAGYPLSLPPTVSEFISIIVSFVQRIS